MTYDYAGHQVLFRQAKARTVAARRCAIQATEQQELGQTGNERRQRERDAVITTLILIQGAAEGYINWIHHEAGIPATGSWIQRWERLPDVAAKHNRSAEFALVDEQRAFLSEIGAWRNYLLHADDRARDRLHGLLASNGNLSESTSPPDLLTADFAEATLQKADELFRWAQDRTGTQAPFLDSAWVALDEY